MDMFTSALGTDLFSEHNPDILFSVLDVVWDAAMGSFCMFIELAWESQGGEWRSTTHVMTCSYK